MIQHTCEGATPKALFCASCGHLLEPGSLRTLRFGGFTGPASINPNVEAFWETGDPSVFEKRPTT